MEMNIPAIKYTLRVQEFRGRWSYVIAERGIAVFVSAYRYGSSATAWKAGQADLDAVNQMENLT
jgi:hypothetical protein